MDIVLTAIARDAKKRRGDVTACDVASRVLLCPKATFFGAFCVVDFFSNFCKTGSQPCFEQDECAIFVIIRTKVFLNSQPYAFTVTFVRYQFPSFLSRPLCVTSTEYTSGRSLGFAAVTCSGRGGARAKNEDSNASVDPPTGALLVMSAAGTDERAPLLLGADAASGGWGWRKRALAGLAILGTVAACVCAVAATGATLLPPKNRVRLSTSVFTLDPRASIEPALAPRASRRAGTPASVTSKLRENPCNTSPPEFKRLRRIFHQHPPNSPATCAPPSSIRPARASLSDPRTPKHFPKPRRPRPRRQGGARPGRAVPFASRAERAADRAEHLRAPRAVQGDGRLRGLAQGRLHRGMHPRRARAGVHDGG